MVLDLTQRQEGSKQIEIIDETFREKMAWLERMCLCTRSCVVLDLGGVRLPHPTRGVSGKLHLGSGQWNTGRRQMFVGCSMRMSACTRVASFPGRILGTPPPPPPPPELAQGRPAIGIQSRLSSWRHAPH